MKTLLNTFFLFIILIGNVYGKIINIDCTVTFPPDNTKIDKSWSLDTVEKNYWSEFSENYIKWVEVVLPEDMDDNKYGYTYFRVDRRTGNLVVEFSISVDEPVKKNHKKLEIVATVYGNCKKGSGEKLF